jgi:AcrR family transcriptional regulator
VDSAGQLFYKDRYQKWGRSEFMGRHREFEADAALDAALDVFWDRGFEGASYADLSAATGVAPAGLYKAFGNKEDFFLKAVERYEERYMAFIQRAIAEPTAHKVIETFLRGSVTTQTAQSHTQGCFQVSGALAVSDDSNKLREEMARRRAHTQDLLTLRLQRAKDEGDLISMNSPEALAGYVMTLVHGMAVQARTGVTKQAFDGMVDMTMRAWPFG